MGDVDEYRCFIGNLSWSTTDDSLKDAFRKFGTVTEAKVVLDKFSGRSRGFAFVTFDEQKAMEEAIEEMNGLDLDGRAITVDKAQPQGPGRDRNGDRDSDRDRGSRNGRDRDRDYGGGRAPRGSGGGGDCFKCGKPGHFARECPDGDGGRGDRYGGRDDRYGGGSRHGSDRGGDRSDRGGDRSDRGGDRSDRGGDRSDRGGDRSSGRSRDGGSGGDRYSRDRSGPY